MCAVPPALTTGTVAGWRLLPLPLGLGWRGKALAPEPRRLDPDRGRSFWRGGRGGGETPGRNRRGSRERMAERREKRPDARSQRTGADRARRRCGGARKGGRRREGQTLGSQGKGSAAGTPCPPVPASGPGGGCRASPEAGPGRAAAAAQVAKPGGGGASSPSPRPAAVEGEVALKGAGAARVRTSARGPRWRRIRWGRGGRVASPRGQNQEGSQTQKRRKLLRRSWGRWWVAPRSTWRALSAGTQDFHKGG